MPSIRGYRKSKITPGSELLSGSTKGRSGMAYKSKCRYKEACLEYRKSYELPTSLFPVCPLLRKMLSASPLYKLPDIPKTGSSLLDSINRILAFCGGLTNLPITHDLITLCAHKENFLAEWLDLIKEDLELLPERLEKDYPEKAKVCRKLITDLKIAEERYAMEHRQEVYLLPPEIEMNNWGSYLGWRDATESHITYFHGKTAANEMYRATCTYPAEAVGVMVRLFNKLAPLAETILPEQIAEKERFKTELSEAVQKACGEADSKERSCVIELADAIWDMIQKAGKWQSAARMFHEANNGFSRAPEDERKRLHQRMYDARDKLGDAVRLALEKVDGTDEYVSKIKRTSTGQWSTELNLVLSEFHSEVYRQGDDFTKSEGERPYEAFLNCLREEQRFLRSVDARALAKATGQQVPVAPTRTDSPLEDPVEEVAKDLAKQSKAIHENIEQIANSLDESSAQTDTAKNGKGNRREPLMPTGDEKKIARFYEESDKTQTEVADELNALLKDGKLKDMTGERFPLSQRKMSDIIKKVNTRRAFDHQPQIATVRRGAPDRMEASKLELGPRNHKGKGLQQRGQMQWDEKGDA